MKHLNIYYLYRYVYGLVSLPRYVTLTLSVLSLRRLDVHEMVKWLYFENFVNLFLLSI